MITHKQLLEILSYDPETGLLTWAAPRPKVRVGQTAGCLHWKGYVHLEVNGKYYAAHRLIWFYMTKRWPRRQIDHRDRDRANNRWSNLRQATNGQNRANSKAMSKHGVKGVAYHPWLKENPWEARVTWQRKTYTLGCYPTKEDAHATYCKEARRLHGKFFNPF